MKDDDVEEEKKVDGLRSKKTIHTLVRNGREYTTTNVVGCLLERGV